MIKLDKMGNRECLKIFPSGLILYYCVDAAGKQKGNKTTGYFIFCTQHGVEGVVWEGQWSHSCLANKFRCCIICSRCRGHLSYFLP